MPGYAAVHRRQQRCSKVMHKEPVIPKRKGAVPLSHRPTTLTLLQLFPKSPLWPSGHLSLCLKREQLDGMSTVVPGDYRHGEQIKKSGVELPLSMALFHSLAVNVPIMPFHMRRWLIVNSTCVCHEDLRDDHLNTRHILKEGRERVAPRSLAPVPFLPLCQSRPPPHWLALWVKFTHSSVGSVTWSFTALSRYRRTGSGTYSSTSSILTTTRLHHVQMTLLPKVTLLIPSP